MGKLEFLKRTLAMGLATMSFVPAVGAVESDDEMEGAPPAKIAKMDFEWDAEHEEKLVKALNLVALFYSQTNIKNYIESRPAEDTYANALRYIFEIFEGKRKFNKEDIRRNLKIIDETTDRGDLYGLYWCNIDECLVRIAPEAREVSIVEKISENCGVLRKQSLFVSTVSDKAKNINLESFKEPYKYIGKDFKVLKDFQRIFNYLGMPYELRVVSGVFGDRVMMAIKKKNGKWACYTSEGMKDITEQEVFELIEHINMEDGGIGFFYSLTQN